MLAPQRQGPRGERRKGRVDALPVVPRDPVVLAVGVVVSLLRPADLVAAEEHRHPLRQREGRDEVALLPRAERVDLRLVGRTLDAVVPGAVVVLAAAASVVTVRLVVLLVVRD